MKTSTDIARWHDIECGAYVVDFPVWEELADQEEGPVLDIGAGTGRVALHLAEAGHQVMALDIEPSLLEELRERARTRELEVHSVIADATEFDIPLKFGLIVVPMQTIQLFPSSSERISFFHCAHRHLSPGGVVAVAITDTLEEFSSDSSQLPRPDQAQHGTAVYQSQPVSIRATEGAHEITRVRRVVEAGKVQTEETSTVTLAEVTHELITEEASQAGFGPPGLIPIPQTTDHVGSTVVMFRA